MGSDYQGITCLTWVMAVQESSRLNPLFAEEEVMENQFADADDDETEAASIHSMAMSVIPQHSPLVGLGLGGPPSVTVNDHPLPFTKANTNRWSYASSTTSSHRGPPSRLPTRVTFPSTLLARYHVGRPEPRPHPIPRSCRLTVPLLLLLHALPVDHLHQDLRAPCRRMAPN